MFKLNFHSNGNIQSIKIGWKFMAVLATIIGSFLSGILSAITKGILIIAIAIQGLLADPDSVKDEAKLAY